MMLYLFLSGTLLTHLRRPTSRMTVSEQHLEGEFRYVNSRLITNAEEVAFYRGNQREKQTMMTAFNRMVEKKEGSIFFNTYLTSWILYRLAIYAGS